MIDLSLWIFTIAWFNYDAGSWESELVKVGPPYYTVEEAPAICEQWRKDLKAQGYAVPKACTEIFLSADVHSR